MIPNAICSEKFARNRAKMCCVFDHPRFGAHVSPKQRDCARFSAAEQHIGRSGDFRTFGRGSEGSVLQFLKVGKKG